MSFADFKQSLTGRKPPAGLSRVLVALWHDGRGDWEAAHDVAQNVPDPEGAWVHAYLHRKEGDHANAAYWYRRANRPVCRESLDAEWTALVQAFLPAAS
jgi:hypothetical protein